MLGADMTSIGSRDVWPYLRILFPDFTDSVKMWQFGKSWAGSWVRCDDIKQSQRAAAQAARARKARKVKGVVHSNK